jgi:hypothetical protein
MTMTDAEINRVLRRGVATLAAVLATDVDLPFGVIAQARKFLGRSEAPPFAALTVDDCRAALDALDASPWRAAAAAGHCRAIGCRRPIADGSYCPNCRENLPICPVCVTCYGEHRPTCGVTEDFVDTGEGPWETEAEAEQFARAECGRRCQVLRGADGRWYLLAETEE